jgi:hypothetical protein
MVCAALNVTIGHDLLRISAVLPIHSNEPQSIPRRPRTIPRKSPMEPEMTKKNSAQSAQDALRSEANLDSRYGEIGISAVVAALQFKCEAKNPAYAPVVHQRDKLSKERSEIAA